MTEKFLVKIYVPSIDELYNVYLLVNSQVGNDIILLNKSIFELSNGEYIPNNKVRLYDRETGEMINTSKLLRDTNVRNGSGLVLL